MPLRAMVELRAGDGYYAEYMRLLQDTTKSFVRIVQPQNVLDGIIPAA
jgi:hypothetical protein